MKNKVELGSVSCKSDEIYQNKKKIKHIKKKVKIKPENIVKRPESS
jgi:hypothetical protein